jgi:hypothetical protein
LFGSILLAGCNGTRYRTERLLKDLRAAGYTVTDSGELIDQGLPVRGRRIEVKDENLYVHEFADAKSADVAAGTISPDGYSIGVPYGKQDQPEPGSIFIIHHVDWIATPHFFKKDALIVIYAGEDEQLIKTLEGLLGEQFAGGRLLWATQSIPYPYPAKLPSAIPKSTLIYPLP